MMNLQDLNANTTNANAEQKEPKLRKCFYLRKHTNKAFSKRASLYKNAFLLNALYIGFMRFAKENLFLGVELNAPKKKDILKAPRKRKNDETNGI